MMNMQLIANMQAMAHLPDTLFIGEIERVSDDELAYDFFKTYLDLGMVLTKKYTRDHHTLMIYWNDWLGWRIIVVDVIL